jgi:DNA-directed RNA polymerase subunit beta'
MFLYSVPIILPYLIFTKLTSPFMELLPLKKSFEYIRINSIIGLITLPLKNKTSIKKIKTSLRLKPRLLFINKNHLCTYFFEQTKKLKFNKLIKSSNCILPLINKSIIGSIFDINSFSLIFHSGTPFFLTSNITLYYYPKNILKEGDIVGIINFDQTISGDIVSGLPKIEEILELTQLSNFAVLAKINGLNQVLAIKKGNQMIQQYTIISSTEARFQQYFLKQKQIIPVCKNNKNSFVTIGQKLTNGELNIKNLISILYIYFLKITTVLNSIYLTFKRIQILLTKQILKIYLNQNIFISSKHIELVIFQLTSKIKILRDDLNIFLKGEILDLSIIKNITIILLKTHKFNLYYKPYIMGISSYAKYERSFLSAASFQTTTTLLALAAIEGRLDWLSGFKENEILGQASIFGTNFKN